MNKIELDGQTSLEDAMREFRILSDQNAHLEQQVTEFSKLSLQLGAENEALRERLAAMTEFYRDQHNTLVAHRDRLQRKCVALITRLSGIKDAIVAAERESHDEAIRDPGAAQIGRLSDEDEAALKDIINGEEPQKLGGEGDPRMPALSYQ